VIRFIKLGKIVALIAFSLVGSPSTLAQQSEPELWRAINTTGHIALMRHSTAPGSDDPPNFTLGDCSTQRNLSSGGRELARVIGDRFRENGIDAADVYSSPWCRCMETSELLDLGTINELMSISSLYQNVPNQPARERPAEIQKWLANKDFDRPTVLVTHQVNITNLTGEFAGEGDMVIASVAVDGTLKVLGKIRAE
jgi:phosphohistidine phosphatase SixA